MPTSITQELISLAQIVFIDLVLAGDNAIVVGLAVAGLPEALKRRAIWMGLGGAVILRILFSVVALKLLAILGLTLAGGLLLLWVAWKLYRELRGQGAHVAHGSGKAKSLRSAVIGILAADLSMSLDNALAVAGAARDNIEILVIGLVLSVALMAIAAEWVARFIERQRWLGYAGLLVVVYVAADMILRGTKEVVQSL
ncbi:MAG TPA: YjbE family putative metal transport protein [Alphaproteobacteria bacterium]|nr:YjbE family putative metal transport protein [Alphaproteobacteria bacterium]